MNSVMIRRARALVVIPFVVVIGCGVSEESNHVSEDQDAGARYRIAYNVWVDQEKDDYDVFVMELDGSGQTNITSDPAVDWAYTAHADRLIIVSDRDDEYRKYQLFELAQDGSPPTKITNFRVNDSWMGVRDDRLVIASSKDGTPDIYIIDRQGNELQRLTDDEVKDNDPVFSPDGKAVVWRSYRTGVDELWWMDLASGETRQITQFPEDDPAHAGRSYHAGPPRWLASGDRVSFCSKRNDNASIFTIRLDGTGLEQVTDDTTDDCYHDWSPDGRYLVYDATDEDGHYDVYLRDLNTDQTTRLTDSPRYEGGPVFVEIP